MLCLLLQVSHTLRSCWRNASSRGFLLIFPGPSTSATAWNTMRTHAFLSWSDLPNLGCKPINNQVLNESHLIWVFQRGSFLLFLLLYSRRKESDDGKYTPAADSFLSISFISTHLQDLLHGVVGRVHSEQVVRPRLTFNDIVNHTWTQKVELIKLVWIRFVASLNGSIKRYRPCEVIDVNGGNDVAACSKHRYFFFLSKPWHLKDNRFFIYSFFITYVFVSFGLDLDSMIVV